MRSAPACRKAGGGVFFVFRDQTAARCPICITSTRTLVSKALSFQSRGRSNGSHTSGLQGETFYGDGTADFSTNGQELIFVGPARLGARSKLMVPNGVNLHLRNSA
ncbi:hypothetical protein FHT76_005517 [Rhizobium sp. BK176]|nr:hypothetical protein [Rhizobium sp. BK399]MCS3741368.1 hypothetical protein [Rhizobium sp. BK661]MCS4093821.1 hypothetical protein [Rhizobium sp. BK176]